MYLVPTGIDPPSCHPHPGWLHFFITGMEVISYQLCRESMTYGLRSYSGDGVLLIFLSKLVCRLAVDLRRRLAVVGRVALRGVALC